MQKTAIKRKPLSNRMKLFVELLPEHKFIAYKAGIAAGFSESYARTRLPVRMSTNVLLKQAIEAKRREIQAKSEYNRAEAHRRLDSIYDMAERQRNPISMTGAVKELNRLYGLITEKLEVSARGRRPADAVQGSRAKLKALQEGNNG